MTNTNIPSHPRSKIAQFLDERIGELGGTITLNEIGHKMGYLLLKADIEGGQGEALNQPWLDEKSYVFLADVAGDWLVDIETLEKEGREGYPACGSSFWSDSTSCESASCQTNAAIARDGQQCFDLFLQLNSPILR